MSRGVYDDEFRDKVVDAFRSANPQFPSTSSAAEWVAREFGVSRDSVRRWASEAGAWEAHNSSRLRALLAENAMLRARLEGQAP